MSKIKTGEPMTGKLTYKGVDVEDLYVENGILKIAVDRLTAEVNVLRSQRDNIAEQLKEICRDIAEQKYGE